MKHEWRKQEKSIYLPKAKPRINRRSQFEFLCAGWRRKSQRRQFC